MSGGIILSHQEINQIVSQAISLWLGPAIFVTTLPTRVMSNDQVDDIVDIVEAAYSVKI